MGKFMHNTKVDFIKALGAARDHRQLKNFKKPDNSTYTRPFKYFGCSNINEFETFLTTNSGQTVTQDDLTQINQIKAALQPCNRDDNDYFRQFINRFILAMADEQSKIQNAMSAPGGEINIEYNYSGSENGARSDSTCIHEVQGLRPTQEDAFILKDDLSLTSAEAQEFMQEHLAKAGDKFKKNYAGTTAVMSYCRQGVVSVANIADSMAFAVIIDGDKVPLIKPLTVDQECSSKFEQIIINKQKDLSTAGDRVCKNRKFDVNNPGRMTVLLGVPRAIGDEDTFGENTLHYEADVTEYDFSPLLQKGKQVYIVTGCDGLMDHIKSTGLSKQKLALALQKAIKEGKDPAQALVAFALNSGSSDNITAAVTELKLNDKGTLVCVFDGHGGPETSKQLKEYMEKAIEEYKNKPRTPVNNKPLPQGGAPKNPHLGGRTGIDAPRTNNPTTPANPTYPGPNNYYQQPVYNNPTNYYWPQYGNNDPSSTVNTAPAGNQAPDLNNSSNLANNASPAPVGQKTVSAPNEEKKVDPKQPVAPQPNNNGKPNCNTHFMPIGAATGVTALTFAAAAYYAASLSLSTILMAELLIVSPLIIYTLVYKFSPEMLTSAKTV